MIQSNAHPTHRPERFRRLLAAWAASCLALAVSTTNVVAGLRENIENIIRTTDFGAATVGVSIRDCATDREIVDISSERPLIPASNMKLITTGAALHGLGPNFRFQTRLMIDENRLWVIGDGDPGFADPELLAQMSAPSTTASAATGLDVESFLTLWLDAIASLKTRNIGSIIVDDRVFDRQFVHPTWPVEQLNRRYCAQISGLSFHLNVLHFYPQPSSTGRPNISRFEPRAPWLTLTNRASCNRGPDDSNSVWIARPPDSNNLTFYGNVKHVHREPVPVTIHDMPSFFAQLLTDRLVDRGIKVAQYRAAATDDPPSPVSKPETTVGPIITTPITTVITRCNRDSQNLYAECLLKRLGHQSTGQPGSWVNGSAAARNIVYDRLRRPSLLTGLVIADGSGLSRENRIAPRTIAAWLVSFHNDSALNAIFYDSLAASGDEGGSGTLSNRFSTVKLHGCQVRAKTGYIEGVSCLSGFITSPDGRCIAFSIMANELTPGRVRNAKSAQERIVASIAEYLSVSTVTLGGD